MNNFINKPVNLGNAFKEEELIHRVNVRSKRDGFMSFILKAKKEIKDGKVLKGNLDDLSRSFD